MSTVRNLCNVCRAELRVPLEAQTVVCPACRNINSYGHPATRQYINYANGPPGNMNANNRYREGPFPSPPQRQPPLHASPRGPRQLSPRGAIGHGYYQPPPPPPPPRPSNNVYYDQSLPLESFRPMRTTSYYQQPPQTSSPHGSPRPVDGNSYYQQAPQTSSPHGSPRPVHGNSTYYQQPSQALSHVPSSHVSPPRVDCSGYYQQPLQTSPHVSSPQMQTHWENGNGYYQPPLRTSPQVSLQSAVQEVSHPPARANNYHQQPSQQSPHTNSPHVQISPQVSNPPKYGRKRAVICGVSYRGQKNSLDGSINDAISMKDFLVHRMRFPDSSIILLTDDEMDPSRIPTKGNMQMALSWLVEGCRPGDSLVFYYSGHGSRERDFDGDEIDGFDEVLCPVDYKTAGKITDDEINATIVRPLPQGVKLHAIIDTCFSGSVIDLPFMCRMNRKGETTWEDQHIQYADYKGTSGGIAISISACDDHQKSGDTTAFTGNSAGALTYIFIQTLTKEPKLTYGRLLKSMRNKITEAQERLGQPPQEPQLSSSEKFDIHSKPIIL